MVRARSPLLVGIVAVAVVLLSAVAAQARVPKVFFGIDQGGYVTAPDYEKMHKTEVRTMRVAINWRRIQPTQRSLDWTEVDSKVTLLARNGITPAIFVFGAPKWATGSPNQGVPPLKGAALRHWKDFLKKAVSRYKQGGQFWKSHPGVPVKAVGSWQIWNEVNLPKYFAKAGTNPPKLVPHAPTAYAKFVKASDKAIGAADRHAKVLLAGLSGNSKKRKQAPPSFIRKFLRVPKVTRHFDAAALHPYAPKVSEYRSRLTKFRRALNKGGAKKKPIWLTEVGWGSASNGQRLNKGLAGQARMLKKSFALTLKKRRQWKIARLFWFDWRDPLAGQPASCSFCPSAGLLKHDGSAKPSYDAFKRFARKQRG